MSTNNKNTFINFIETKLYGRIYVLKMKSRLQKLSKMRTFTLQQLIRKNTSYFSLACLPFIFNDKNAKKKVMIKLLKNKDNKLSFRILKSIFSPIISMSFLDNEVVLDYFKNAGEEDLKVFSMLLEEFNERGKETIISIHSSIDPKINKEKAKHIFNPEEYTISKVAFNKITMQRIRDSKMKQKIRSLNNLFEKYDKLYDLTKEETNSLREVIGEYVKKITNNKLVLVVRSYYNKLVLLKKKFDETNDITYLENEFKRFNSVNYIMKKLSGGFMMSIIKSFIIEFRRRDANKDEINGDWFLPEEKVKNALLFMSKMGDASNRNIARLLEVDSNIVIFSSWFVELTEFYYETIISSRTNQLISQSQSNDFVEPLVNRFNDKPCTPLSKWLTERFDFNSNWLVDLKEFLLKNFEKGGNKKEVNTFFELYKKEQNPIWKFYEQNGVAIYNSIPKELMMQFPHTKSKKLKIDHNYEAKNPGYLRRYLQFRFYNQIENLLSHPEKLNSKIRYLSTKDEMINGIAIEYLNTVLTNSLDDLEEVQKQHEIAKTMLTMYQVNYDSAKSIIPKFVFNILNKSKLTQLSVAYRFILRLEQKKSEILERMKFKKVVVNIMTFLVEDLEKLNILEWDFLRLVLKKFGYNCFHLKSNVEINSILKKINFCLNQKNFFLNLLEKPNSLFAYHLKYINSFREDRIGNKLDPIKSLVSIFVKRSSIKELPPVIKCCNIKKMKVQHKELLIASIKTLGAIELQNIGLDYC